jgi:soluble lytic murein transglycosylase-like protein
MRRAFAWLPSLAVMALPAAALLAPTFKPCPPCPLEYNAIEPDPIIARIRAEAVSAGVRPGLAIYVAWRESRFDPLAVGTNKDGSHDWGIGQINDRTVRLLHVADPLDVGQNIIAFVGVLGMGLDKCGSERGALNYYAKGRCK